jgi:hypothetical protein
VARALAEERNVADALRRVVARHAAEWRRQAIARLELKIEEGRDNRQMRADTNPKALARFVAATVYGMSLQARDGADEVALLDLADLATAEIDRWRRHG